MAPTPSPNMPPSRQVLMCNHKTCHQQGAEAVLGAFQAELPEDASLAVLNCLGQCGNGPMVLILPEGIWYSHVQPRDVPKIVEQHLQQGNPVRENLCRELHPDLVADQWAPLVWAMVGLSLTAMVGLLTLGLIWAWPGPSV